jgi:hypothetical protein
MQLVDPANPIVCGRCAVEAEVPFEELLARSQKAVVGETVSVSHLWTTSSNLNGLPADRRIWQTLRNSRRFVDESEIVDMADKREVTSGGNKQNIGTPVIRVSFRLR